MGYYGLGPGQKVADRLTDFERVLRGLPLESATALLAALEALTRNIVRLPKEGAHRQISLSDENFSLIVGSREAIDILRTMGWEVDGDPLVLPSTVTLDFQGHVVKIIDAKNWYVKERERIKKLGKMQADPAKAAVAAEMEIDRRERAAKAAASSGNAPPVSPKAAEAAAPASPPKAVPAATTPSPAATAPTAAPAVTTPSTTATVGARSSTVALPENVPSPEVVANELRRDFGTRDAATAYLHQVLEHLNAMPDWAGQPSAARGQEATTSPKSPGGTTTPAGPVDLKQLALDRQKRNAANGTTGAAAAAPAAEENSSCTVC